ncbi:hypothetical protein SPI_08243 [Niveomyces insectorum RCEF 264]|uniref:Uncharacterized protein n=1 Tax=Niveomyces insectorum RCEF 264 TaxID=1081102 RepID=A0A167NHG4_9HYPO|nr:hypothetical protein SPI_08243 [Niveomyces insectorum RCEF 264]
MLDENLPTFIFRPVPDHPSSAVVYFTRSGSDPAPEYVLRFADPVSKPACRGVYAVALTDPYRSDDVVYGEVAVTPEWQQPTLSAAELRDQREQQQQQQHHHSRGSNDTGGPPTAKTPDAFAIQLYNPDQTVTVRWMPGSWNKTESWEFDMPVETFRMPSASRLDRPPTPPPPTAAVGGGGGGGGGGGTTPAGNSLLAPKNAFRWKRDGRLGNKDMTCYLVGKAVGLQRSKEPDITVALCKHARDPAVTIYEPNLQRVDVQDRKGLDLVLLLGAQVIRDLYLVPRADAFNVEGGLPPASMTAGGGKRKNSRPIAGSVPLQPQPNVQPLQQPLPSSQQAPTSSASAVPSAAAIDAETQRLQALLVREERERARREREEEKRIKKMLEAEEKERRRRAVEVARETERLRKLYGVEGQDLPSSSSGPSAAVSQKPVASSKARPVPTPPPPPPPPPANSYMPNHPYGYASGGYAMPPLPPRPVSAGPADNHSTLSAWWHGPSGNSGSGSGSGSNHRKSSGFLSNPAASVSGFFSSPSTNRDRASSSAATGVSNTQSRVQKKRSVHF